MTNDRLRMAAVAPAPGGEPLLTAAKPANRPTPEIVAQPMVCQQAAPGNVCTRELPGRCWIVRTTRTRDRYWEDQQTFAGAACQAHAQPG